MLTLKIDWKEFVEYALRDMRKKGLHPDENSVKLFTDHAYEGPCETCEKPDFVEVSLDVPDDNDYEDLAIATDAGDDCT
jgi:hypothetical protein